MPSAVVISAVNPVRSLLIGAVVLCTACSPQSSVHPSPSAKVSVSPSSTAAPTPTQSYETTLLLSALQRLNPNVGYIAGWTGSGLGLAKTSDGGMTWQRLPMPADHLAALRFINEGVGWAGGFVNRDVPQIACHQAAPAGAQPCKGVVLRTEDGGNTWQTVLA